MSWSVSNYIYLLGPSSARKKGANNDHDDDDAKPSTSGAADPAAEKDNAFKQFRRVCADIAEVPGYNDKTSRVAKFLDKGTSGGKSGFQEWFDFCNQYSLSCTFYHTFYYSSSWIII